MSCIRLFISILLCLALSGFGYAQTSSSGQQSTMPQAGTVHQSVQTGTSPDEPDDPPYNSPDQNGNYRVKGDVIAPRLVHQVEPNLSKQDWKAVKPFRATFVVIQMVVDKDGRTQNAHITKSSAGTIKRGHDKSVVAIDQSALDAVQRYSFQPAMLNGQAIPALINVQVTFSIF